MLLTKPTAIERAAYVLREAFAYPYRRISQVLAVSEANARQVVARSRSHLSGDQRSSAGATEQRRFEQAFVAAATSGDLVGLGRLVCRS